MGKGVGNCMVEIALAGKELKSVGWSGLIRRLRPFSKPLGVFYYFIYILSIYFYVRHSCPGV